MFDSLKNLTVRLAGVTEESVVDGLGIRFTVFTQGCPHACAGCHNPSAHDVSGGYLCNLSELAARYQKNPLLDGVTFSGGEPFGQAGVCAAFAKFVHEAGGNVWTYSGYTYEELTELAGRDLQIQALLAETDVLVDGRYVQEERDLMLVFKGSKNQRILDLKSMREQGSAKIILLSV